MKKEYKIVGFRAPKAGEHFLGLSASGKLLHYQNENLDTIKTFIDYEDIERNKRVIVEEIENDKPVTWYLVIIKSTKEVYHYTNLEEAIAFAKDVGINVENVIIKELLSDGTTRIVDVDEYSKEIKTRVWL